MAVGRELGGPEPLPNTKSGDTAEDCSEVDSLLKGKKLNFSDFSGKLF